MVRHRVSHRRHAMGMMGEGGTRQGGLKAWASAVHRGHVHPWQIKGSAAAKERMAQLRAMKRRRA